MSCVLFGDIKEKNDFNLKAGLLDDHDDGDKRDSRAGGNMIIYTAISLIICLIP